MTTTTQGAPATKAPPITPPHTITLHRPVRHGNETISSLTFQEFEAAWMEECPIDLSQMRMGDVMRVTAKACGQPYAVVKKLGFKDLQACAEVVAVFFDDGPAAGGTA